MKRYLSDILAVMAVLIMVLFFAISVEAAPFLVCDPQPGVTSYKVTGLPFVTASVPAQPDGSIKLDVAPVATGPSNITFAACIIDPVWGEACSAFVPFSFTRPASPALPMNTRLSKD